MSRLVLRHIAIWGGLLALVSTSLPRVADAATRTRVRVRVCSKVTHRCHYVYKYVYSRGTALGVKSYQPSYNAMSVGTSRKGVAPRSAIAVCADGKYAYGTPSKSTCSTHHGVAWWFVKH